MKCPNCGNETSGKFCSSCGAALAGASCSVCAAPLTAGARFCHVCGTPLGASRRSAGRNQVIPWIVSGVAVALLVVVFVARSGGPGAAQRAGAAPAGMPGGTATTDLSSMTPREQADRLFDRVMTASEGGNAGEVTFFGPMALQAYGMIGQLDADARFHVGLIEAALATDTGATAQADSLAKEFPRHLFVPLIRWEVANRRGDTAALRRVYRQFLDTYDAETASGKNEYEMHRTRLQAFRDEARGALGATSR